MTAGRPTVNAANYTQPDWPTTVRARLSGGRVIGTDNSMWLYRAVPLEPVADAKTSAGSLVPALPIIDAFEELSSMASVRVARRSASRGTYRKVHILLINVPDRYHLPPDQTLASYLNTEFSNVEVQRRVLLFGVQLRSSIGSGGLRSAVDSVVETLVTRNTPITDFDRDYAKVDAALSRAGMRTPTEDEFTLANSWWSTHRDPATPFVPHAGHLHVFNSIASAQAADRSGPDDCSSWPKIPGQYVLTFAAIQDFNLPFAPATTPDSRWVDALRIKGSLAVSIRGLVEPAKVTRQELRRRRKQYMDDIEERYKAGKMERAEQERLLTELTAVEAAYANGGPPTLVDAVVTCALNGSHADLYRSAEQGAFSMTEMAYRQPAAMAETWLASPVTANPHQHDIPCHTIAYSGLPSLSRVGDKQGAQLGLTQRDRQPAFVSHIAASRGDGLPVMSVFGATGSGKLLPLDAPIPTPSGWTTMGRLQVGDEVLGRDGKPCRVTFLSDINEAPDLYEITLSDGQVIEADADHQWVVSTFRDRNSPRDKHHLDSVRRWEAAQSVVERLIQLSDRFGDADEATLRVLFKSVKDALGKDCTWRKHEAMRAALNFVECPSRMAAGAGSPQRWKTRETFKTDPVLLFPVIESLRACVSAWQSTSGGNRRRWGTRLAAKVSAAVEVMAESEADDEATAAEIARRLVARGAEMSASSTSRIRELARAAGVQPRKGFATVVVPHPERSSSARSALVYPTALAIKSLALRVSQQYADRPTSEAAERRMTTAEMLAEGLRESQGQSRYAIRLSEPVDLPERELPIDPWLLGAWLGDGTSDNGDITVGGDEIDVMAPMIQTAWYGRTTVKQKKDGTSYKVFCTRPNPDLCPYGHSSGFRTKGDGPRVCVECTRVWNSIGSGTGTKTDFGDRTNIGLITLLREVGVYRNKHIPMEYLRASRAQRLALLQGLMDADGNIGKSGSCDLTLTDGRLTNDALTLVRSLGFKASMSSGDAKIIEADPDRPGRRRSRKTGTAWMISFTTAEKVFRMPRKLARLKEEVRETQKWLYITDIQAAKSRPGRCIQVDSADHTYLCHDFVPTSNTQLLLWLANQFATANVPQIIFDPKLESDHTAAVLASGGRVASLDSLISADGVLDPMRFSASPEKGIEAAAAMLMSVNPWGSKAEDFYTPVMKALKTGVAGGATCIGQALKIALEHGADKHVLQPVFDLADSSPAFRACVGMDTEAPSLRVADGITLIKVGSNALNLPPANLARNLMSPPQRAAVNLIRMVTIGSMRALANRDGVLHLDEAWTVLGSGTSEMDEIGRTARSQRVLPILYTQRCTDALNAGLTGYISRVVILPIADPEEAKAACLLAGLEPTDERMAAITARATVGDAPNWDSMRALRDPRTGKVLRGSIGIYSDLDDRAIPVEVKIPPEFLRLASTNPDDIERRLRQQGKPVEANILG